MTQILKNQKDKIKDNTLLEYINIALKAKLWFILIKELSYLT